MVEKKNNLVEVARSFSYRLNTGNYQSVDFFCSQKVECLESEASEKSEALYNWCKEQVMKAVNQFKAELADPLAKVKEFVASGKTMNVNEWENLTTEEQAFLQGVKRQNNRTTYAQRVADKQKGLQIDIKKLNDERSK